MAIAHWEVGRGGGPTVRQGGTGKQDEAGREGERQPRRLAGQTCGYAGPEIGPGYDRFAWLAHIRQIHGDLGSRIVEIPLRPSAPLPSPSPSSSSPLSR